MKKFYSVLFALTLGASSLLANPEAVAAQNMGTDIAAAGSSSTAGATGGTISGVSTAAATGGTIAGVSAATVGIGVAVAAAVATAVAVGTSDSSVASHHSHK